MIAFNFVCSALFALGLAGMSSVFDRPYDLPQGFCLWLLASLLLVREVRVRLRWDGLAAVSLFAVLGCVAAVGLLVAFVPAIPFSLALMLLAILLGFLFTVSNQNLIFLLRRTLVVVAVFESVLAVCSYLGSGEDLNLLAQLNGAPVGSVGNSDFLATVIAAGIFVLWSEKGEKSFHRILKFGGLGLLFVGLVSTRSRGTAALTLVLLAAPYIPMRFRNYLKLTTPVAAAVATLLLWPQLTGRIQLWLVSIKSFAENPWTGVGLEHFSSAYFNTNLQMMRENPWFRAEFGPWSSQVSDAHNFILQWCVETGVVGGVLAGLLLFLLVRRAWNSEVSNRSILLTLVAKSFYTVVWTSTQGVAVGSLAWADSNCNNRKVLNKWAWLAVSIGLGLIGKSIVMNAFVSVGMRNAMTQLKIGVPGVALETLERAHKADPKNTDVLLAQSFALMKSNRCIESRAVALRAAEIRQDMDVFKRAGHILYDCAFYDEALSLFEPLNIVFPEHRTTIMKMAQIQYNVGNWSKADELAEEIIRLQPRRKSYSDEHNLSEAKRILSLIQK